MKQLYKSYFLLAALALGAFSQTSQGASITQTYNGGLPASFSGTLPNQGTALEQTFTLASPGSLNIFTSSYGMGGFQTNLFLFNSMGSFITAGVPAGMPDPNTGFVGDSRLTASNLAAGKYIFALTDFLLNQSLTATNLSDGFTSNFGDGTTFVDANGFARTGDYSLTVGLSSVPEPSAIWITAPVLAWLGLRARKRHRNSSGLLDT